MGETLIARIIIQFNQLEFQLKEIIGDYIASNKDFFVKEFLLNNLTMNFSTKYKVLKYIIRETGIITHKDFDKGVNIVMSIRNAVAHSDQLDIMDIIYAEYDHDGMQNPIYGLNPSVTWIENSELVVDKLESRTPAFDKYHSLIFAELEKIAQVIKDQNHVKVGI